MLDSTTVRSFTLKAVLEDNLTIVHVTVMVQNSSIQYDSVVNVYKVAYVSKRPCNKPSTVVRCCVLISVTGVSTMLERR